MPGVVQVSGLETIRATMLALLRLEPDMRKHVAATMGRITPDFQRTVRGRASRAPRGRVMTRLVGDTAEITGSDYSVQMRAGYSGSAVSAQRLNPLTPSEHSRAFEFGSNQQSTTTKYGRRSPKGRLHVVTRHASRQMPTRSRSGWAFYPGARDIQSRVVPLWFQTAIRTLHEAFERR